MTTTEAPTTTPRWHTHAACSGRETSRETSTQTNRRSEQCNGTAEMTDPGDTIIDVDWTTLAACRQHPAHWWDDTVDGADEEPWEMAHRHERAAGICAACPVQRQCEAARRATDCGIWAGRLYKWRPSQAAAAARIWNPYAKGSDERLRRIAAMSAAGATAREIGRELGMHHRSVVRTRARIAAATRGG